MNLCDTVAKMTWAVGDGMISNRGALLVLFQQQWRSPPLRRTSPSHRLQGTTVLLQYTRTSLEFISVISIDQIFVHVPRSITKLND